MCCHGGSGVLLGLCAVLVQAGGHVPSVNVVMEGGRVGEEVEGVSAWYCVCVVLSVC